MAYSPTSWTTTTPRSTDNLNNLETQYTEAITDGVALRADATKPFVLHVSSAEPASASTGQTYFNSASKSVNFYDGSAWRALGVGGVKSVQHFYEKSTASNTKDIGITAVVSTNSYCTPTFAQLGGYDAVTIYLLDSTTVRMNLAHTANAYSHAFSVIEHYPGVIKSLTRGAVTINDTGISTNIAVDVVPSKSIVSCSYYNNSVSVAPGRYRMIVPQLASSSVLTLHKYTTEHQAEVRYEVIEFY